LYAVKLKSSGVSIGDCGLEHTVFEGIPCIEIGYDFVSDYWNMGYATEAASAVRDYAVDVLGIDRDHLCSFIRKSNVASIRVSEKIGMKMVTEYWANGVEYLLYAFSRKHFTK
jgi:RimJ/RimL family protein N-acetyltransferase